MRALRHILILMALLSLQSAWSQISCDSLYKKRISFNYNTPANVGKAPDTLRPGMILRPTNIVYALGKPDMLPEYKDSLKLWAQIIKQHPELVFEIAVHSDSRGRPDLNTNITAARASAVYEYLVKSCEVEACNLRKMGYGETQLLVSDAEILKHKTKEETEPLHAKNRRTELRVIGYKK
jgi:outer membrane protein OmpA-like peptidoglycan-associated protein